LQSVTRTVLDWMGTGRAEEIVAVHEAIGNVLREEAPELLREGRPDPREELAVFALHLLEMLSVYLRAQNLARPLGQLSGKRYARWRGALAVFRDEPGPLSTHRLLELTDFENPSTLKHALHQMEQMGLVGMERDGRAASWMLTWMGRRVADTLSPPEPVALLTPLNEFSTRQAKRDCGILVDDVLRPSAAPAHQLQTAGV